MSGTFNPVNPVVVGLSTKADHYHRAFNNGLAVYAGEMSLADQAALDFLYASSPTQLARVAAIASHYPRLKPDGSAWEMKIPTTGPHALFFPCPAFRPTPTNGCGVLVDIVSTNVISGMPFDQSTTERAYWWYTMPPSWDGGTITARFKTFNINGGSNTYVFSLAALACNDGDLISGSLGTAQQVTITPAAAYAVRMSAATPAITIGGSPAAGSSVLFVASRLPLDGNDNYGSKAYLAGVEITLNTVAENDA